MASHKAIRNREQLTLTPLFHGLVISSARPCLWEALFERVGIVQLWQLCVVLWATQGNGLDDGETDGHSYRHCSPSCMKAGASGRDHEEWCCSPWPLSLVIADQTNISMADVASKCGAYSTPQLSMVSPCFLQLT